jgi:hypothetical protein
MTDPDIITVLRRWWTKKYRLPVSSLEWENSYFEDLFVEFYEDLMENDKELARELRVKYTGMEVGPSGDSMADMWERQIARGEVPDLSLGDTPEEIEYTRQMQEYLIRRAEEQGIPWWEPVQEGAMIGGKRHQSSKVDMYGELGTRDNLEERGFEFPDLESSGYESNFQDGFRDLDYREQANSDQLPMDMMSSMENVSGEAFDEFMNAVGGFKK